MLKKKTLFFSEKENDVISEGIRTETIGLN